MKKVPVKLTNKKASTFMLVSDEDYEGSSRNVRNSALAYRLAARLLHGEFANV